MKKTIFRFLYPSKPPSLSDSTSSDLGSKENAVTAENTDDSVELSENFRRDPTTTMQKPLLDMDITISVPGSEKSTTVGPTDNDITPAMTAEGSVASYKTSREEENHNGRLGNREILPARHDSTNVSSSTSSNAQGPIEDEEEDPTTQNLSLVRILAHPRYYLYVIWFSTNFFNFTYYLSQQVTILQSETLAASGFVFPLSIGI